MTNPTSLNVQLEQLAEEAVRVAAEKFGQTLDYSENSLVSLEALLQQAFELYESKETGKEIPEETIQTTSRVWGSYLGELMRRKWGGEWVVSGSDVDLTINGKNCSPIQQVFQRITNGQQYDTRVFFARIASDVAESQGKQADQALNKTLVHERINLKKIKELIDSPSPGIAELQGKQAVQVLDETPVDEQIDLPKPEELIENAASEPAEPNIEQADQVLKEIVVNENIDLLNALVSGQKEQSKILKAIRRSLGTLIAFIIILILVLAGGVFIIYSLLTQMQLF
jgi:hypothetical protein